MVSMGAARWKQSRPFREERRRWGVRKKLRGWPIDAGAKAAQFLDRHSPSSYISDLHISVTVTICRHKYILHWGPIYFAIETIIFGYLDNYILIFSQKYFAITKSVVSKLLHIYSIVHFSTNSTVLDLEWTFNVIKNIKAICFYILYIFSENKN